MICFNTPGLIGIFIGLAIIAIWHFAYWLIYRHKTTMPKTDTIEDA